MLKGLALTPVSYVIFRLGSKVLLQLRQGTGYMDGHWATAAAGHVEPGELASEAACREALEELGVTITTSDLLPLTTMQRYQDTSTTAGRVDFFFVCKQWSGSPQVMEADKSAGLEWFDLAELPEVLVPHERYVLERLESGLSPIVSFGFPVPELQE